MSFYFCGRYINTDADEKKVERDTYAAIPYFWSSGDHYGYEKWESNLEAFFSYFILTEVLLYPNEAGWKNLLLRKRRSCRLSMLVCIKRSPYFVCSTLFYSSEADYKELEVVDELKSEIIDKPDPEDVDEADPEPTVIVELNIIDEPELEVVDEAEFEPEVK